MTDKTLYQQLGEGAGIASVVDGLYLRIAGDPTLAPYFTETRMIDQKRHMALFLAAATGGPNGYKGLDMGAAHAGRGITDADFDSVIGHAAAALSEAGVDDETIGEVAAALMPLRAQVVTGETVDA
ncbi:group I truncated hemoglobin [Microbacterium sp. ASV49]|uniref:Group 1 truncated hemoglobin n=1 Tax=Microbacterium candidum TaxID=3041922 RepID=A0ABT7MVB1_9MICO|nr:group 1 truncated hemoglobin [Microbacterium sp. ASV49]MDL9978360.1 group 1 truncated hemoglobin [Microbacterium sp. ASV49]